MAQHIISFDNEHMKKWQKMLDLISQIAQIPAALIMRLVEGDIEVYAASQNSGNPYTPGEKTALWNSGLYCESTIKSDHRLLVPNALKDQAWRNNPDMALSMVSYLGFPIHYPDKSPFGTICVLDRKENAYSSLIEDVLSSFRDAIETDLTLMTNNEKLEMLLKEVHHRVKNNIASIESFLTLQSSMTDNQEARSILQRAAGRVEYMHRVYMRLLLDDAYARVSMKEYIEELMDAVLNLFSHKNKSVEAACDIEALDLDASLAMNIGLIINELATNSLKYAFDGNEAGEIRIGLKKTADRYELLVSDNGKGMAPGFSLEDSGGFGLSIVGMLVEQIRGTMELSSQKGCSYRITWTGA